MSFNLIAPKEEQTSRLKTCMSCEQLKLMAAIKVMQCRACGCPIKTKVPLQFAKCPEGKW